MSLVNLKKELEAVLLIVDWSPTEANLIEIACQINNLGSSASKGDIGEIVFDVVGSYRCMVMEGIDNADLTTLLLLATRITR